jgi:hypothetical protein
LSGVDRRLAVGAALQQFAAAAVEPALQFGDEGEGLRRQNLLAAGTHRGMNGDAVSCHPVSQ